MKRIIMLGFACVALMGMPSCKESSDGQDGKSNVVQDSLITVFPTWQSANIFVLDNKTEFNVVIGDATFYKATPEAKAKKAEELGRMVLRIYGPGNYIAKGNLVVTADVRNTSAEPKDGISTPIPFAELKK